MSFASRLENARQQIEKAEFVIVGAGAGLSAAAGITYDGERFTKNFSDFIERYDLTDMYSSGFFPFPAEEEKWAYWARHIKVNRYDPGPLSLYQKLFQLVSGENYFVITTNVDHQFQLAGFDERRIFATQGDYGLFQCAHACHKATYDNEKMISEMVRATEDCRIPSALVPHCPHCCGPMEVNLRKDDFFVEDQAWHQAAKRYAKFVQGALGKKIVFLELGVGYNTPGIIRIPFEQMTYSHPECRMIRLNRDHPEGVRENAGRTIAFTEDMGKVLDGLL